MTVLLGFDYGKRRTGVAIGNRISGSARPLKILHSDDQDKLLALIAPFITDWQPSALVVGLPTHPDGAAHAMTLAARQFAAALTQQFGLPVWLMDERYSSVEAGGDDAAAAAVILQRYLDEHADAA